MYLRGQSGKWRDWQRRWIFGGMVLQKWEKDVRGRSLGVQEQKAPGQNYQEKIYFDLVFTCYITFFFQVGTDFQTDNVPLQYFYSKTMKIIISCLLLAAVLAAPCGKGGLQCDQDNCHYPAYIEGCLTYAPDSSCAACEYNYQLSSGRCLYLPNPQGNDCCEKFNTTSGACLSCSKGLFLSASSGLCEDRKIEGCLVKSNGACSLCASDYDLVGSLCVKAISGCTAYDQYLNCVACSSSFTLLQGTCVPALPVSSNIPNCKLINEYGCAECNSGWTAATDGSCKPTPQGCLVLAADGTCRTCQSPFFQLQNGQCAIVGCLKINGGACTQCNSALGFTLTNGLCSITNCLYFTNSGCSTCQGGLIAGSWGCKSTTQRVCLICKINEYLGSDGQCKPKNIRCTKYQNGVCVSCCDSYYLDASGICQQMQFGCVYSNGVCSSCLAPFTLANGACTISGCMTYNSQGCVTCDSRLILANNICTLPFCQQISNFLCVSCIQGYQLTNSGCLPVDPNCLNANSQNVCLKCKDGYQLGKDGVCTATKVGCNYVDGICTSCRAPFSYVPSTQSCVIDGCLTYFLGGCSQCDSKYTLLYNSCKLPNCLTSSNGKCLQCDPDYVFTSLGLCVSKDEFCDKMNEYGVCIKCLSTHYYSQISKKCIKKAPGCNYDNGICVSCISPFTFADGRCNILGCQTYTDNGCLACNYPFSLTPRSTCEIANCNAYSAGACIGCSQGYALSKTKLCVAQDPNCLNYNTEQTQCQTCIKGYRFDDDGRCEYADAHCWQFDATGTCMTCDRIYFLNPFGKCQLRDPQCAVYTNGYCTQCAPYFYVSAGVCMGNTKGCKKQKSASLCLECDSGYTLKDGSCRIQITHLSWNSIDMDFGDDDESKSVFTAQFTNTTNLIQAIASGSAQVFFSSSAIANALFQVDSQGTSGWSPVGQPQGAFVGIKTSALQTYYAVDIRVLSGSTMTKFSLQYSIQGNTFVDMGTYSLEGVVIGTVKTFYFKPVYAQYIRIVAQSGTPNIKFEFYYSSGQVSSSSTSYNNTFITKTLIDSVDTAYGGETACSGKGLCWAGVEACEPRKLAGFSVLYTNGTATDGIDTVTIDYSMDGISYSCFNNCQELPLANDAFTFPSPLLAMKVRVHFSKYRGNPRFGIKFNWAS